MPRQGLSTQRVVDAAAELADREGTASLTLARLAAELDVRTPSLYNHVDGLDDLQALLTVRALADLGARLQRAGVGRSDADAVRAIARAYRDFALEHPGLYPFVVPTTEVTDRRVREAGDELLTVVLAVLGSFGLEQDAIHAARMLRSAIHGFVSLEQSGGFGLPQDIDASFEWLVEGVVAALASRRRTASAAGAASGSTHPPVAG